ncbi:MAG: glycosyltransferase family 4 protein [Sphingomonadales bacterium]|nr:glycosyltransferase family 4 protein [Sphingomonadales bacterium]
MTFLFLYTELAGYSMDCFREHLRIHPEDSIHVVHYPINPEAPFQFNVPVGVVLHEKKKLGSEGIYDLIKQIRPSVILMSGWQDKDYLRLARMASKTYRFVLCLDNTWRNTWKQWLLLLPARFIVRSITRFCWVPGEPQKKYAVLLGFNPDNVFTGFYAANLQRYRDIATLAKSTDRPRRFLVVARYIPQKGYDILWKAFMALHKDGSNKWELWCAGTGSLYEHRIQFSGIRHLGFVQPNEMEYLISQTDVFVLPSRFEPWGVAVQEFAAAGMPLILSDAVNAHHAFLRHQGNGFLFKSGDAESLQDAMQTMMNASDAQLLKMGAISAELAGVYDSHAWSATLHKLASV